MAVTGLEPVVVGAGAGVPSPLSIRVTRAAAVLEIGCFEHGSQSVSVSSLAAWPLPLPGFEPPGSSQ